MAEFMPDGVVLVEDKDNEIKVFKVNELIPHAFTLES